MQGEDCWYIELLIFNDKNAFEQFLFCLRGESIMNNLDGLDGAVILVNVCYSMI